MTTQVAQSEVKQAKAIQHERTALAQTVTRQPDGPGKRIGKRAELTGIGKVTTGGARIFRERLPQFQAEPAYWEKRIGTVHDFRVFLFDNDDTRILFTIVFDGDFKPYVADLINTACYDRRQPRLGRKRLSS